MFAELLPFLAIVPPLLYGLLAYRCAREFFSERQNCSAASVAMPAVTILKPVKGCDPESYENFASFCRQGYPEYQLIFAIARHDDPAVPLIRRLLSAFPAVDIDLVIDPTIHGPNYKVGNLINAYPHAKHDLLVLCDGDVRVEPGFLRAVAAPFADPAVGLVTSPYRSGCVKSVAGAIEALGITTEMVPNVLVARRLEGLSFALGAAMAVRRQALEAIGGLAPLANYLADDYQLGNRIHRAGWRLVLSGQFVTCVQAGESLATTLARQLRWARTMRVSRPAGYLASGITLPFPAAVLALLLAGGSARGWWAAGLLYLVRAGTATRFSRSWVRDGLLPKWLWLLPFRDALAFGTWALAFLGRRVTWRGHRYRVLSDGKLEELA